MSLQNLLDKITTRHRERQQDRVTEYLALVGQIVAEEEPDPDEVERILREAGKTFDDLQKSVLLRRERHELRAQLDRCIELQTHRPKLEQQVAAADRELEQGRAKHNQVTAPLYAQLQEIKTAAHEIFALRQKLDKTCDNPLISEPLAATRTRLGQISARQYELRKKMTECDAWAKSDREELAGGPLPVRAEQLNERAKINETVVAKCQAGLAELEHELVMLNQREEQFRQQALVP